MELVLLDGKARVYIHYIILYFLN